MSKNQKGGVESCTDRYRYLHPWVFTTQPYGISIKNVLCYADECSGCPECKDIPDVKTEGVQVNTLSEDQVRNSFNAMLEAMKTMDANVKILQARIDKLESKG